MCARVRVCAQAELAAKKSKGPPAPAPAATKRNKRPKRDTRAPIDIDAQEIDDESSNLRELQHVEELRPYGLTPAAARKCMRAPGEESTAPPGGVVPLPQQAADGAALVALQEQNARLMQLLEVRHSEQRPVALNAGPPAPAPVAAAQQTLRANSPPKSNLPAGWKSRLDKQTGRLYYYNKELGTSQFEHPSDSPPLPPPPVPAQPPGTPIHYRNNPSLEAELGEWLGTGPSTSHASSSSAHSTHGRSQWQFLEDMHAEHNAKAAYAPSEHVRAYHAAEAARIARRMSQ